MSANPVLRFFITHPVAANLLMALLILAGLHSASTIKQEIFPDFAPPAVMVEGELPGFSASQVEKGSVVAIERELRGEAGVDRVEAVVEDGQFEVTVELTRDASVDRMTNVIKSRIDGIDSFPEEMNQLRVYPRDDRSQLMWVNLSGDRSVQDLSAIGHQLAREIERIEGVGSVELRGIAAEEIAVEVNHATLREYGLTLEDIGQELGANNKDLDSGHLMGQKQIPLFSRNESVDPLAVAQRPVQLTDHTTGHAEFVLVGDLADVKRQFEQPGTISRLNGQNTVGLAIIRSDESSPLTTSDQVQAYLAARAESLPADLKIEGWLDESRELSSRMTLMSNNGLIGLALVFILLLLFTHWRVAFWVAAGLPVAYLGAIWAMQWPGVGITLNVMSLFGFLIVSGILVDDALVVGESIYDEFSKGQHKTANEAALAGLQRVAMPATFGVLTTIAAFFPLTLLEGDIGSAVGAIAVMIVLCLLFSIVESKLILPAHISHGFAKSFAKNKGKTSRGMTAFGQRFFDSGRARYLRLLNWALDRPTKVVSFSKAALIICLALVISNRISVDMVPEVADYEIEAVLYTPVNSSIQEQDVIVRQIEDGLRNANSSLKDAYEMDYLPVAQMFAATESTQAISILAELQPRLDNPVSAFELIELWRSHIPTLPAGYSLALSASAEPDEGINVQLEGADEMVLRDAAEELKMMLQSYPGVSDIRDNLNAARTEYQMHLTDEARQLGVTIEDVSTAVRYAVYGLEVQRIQLPDQEIKVMVRYPETQRADLADLLDMYLDVGLGEAMPLSQLVTIEAVQGLALIRRVDGQRAINVMASHDDNLATADQIMDVLEDGYLETLIERYAGLTYRVEGEARESEEMETSLLLATALALVVVYGLLALPLRSYREPLWVMSVVPFSLIGVILAHAMFGIGISIMSLFGAVSLIGVLVNDSLVLLHQLKQLPMHNVREAIVQACSNRFRPIVMTSITTFFGVMPIIFERDPEAQWLVPIAISLGFGILFGTLVTLVLMPAMLIRKADFLQKTWGTDSLTAQGNEEPHAKAIHEHA